MSSTKNTSVVATFSEGASAGAEAGIAIREDANLSTTIGVTFLKVYPKLPDLFFITAGSYRSKGNKEEPASTAVAFDLTKESALPIHGAREVKITPQGNAYDELGEVISVSYSYDAISGAVRASKRCYAVVLVNYTAPYTLLEYEFAGAGCPLTPVNNPNGLNEYDGYYTAAMAVAVDTEREKKASLQLKPPQCGAGLDMSLNIEANKRILPKLVIEPDDGIGVQLAADLPNISAGGNIRLYPAGTAAEVSSTIGKLSRKGIERNLEIREFVTFNGDSSQSLTYPPINKAGSIGETIQVTNPVGNPITVALATGGDQVVMAAFHDDGSYTITGRRVVENDEVVPVNTFGIAIPVWGTASIAYSTSYEILRFRPDATTGKRKFDNAMITAKRDERVASYKIDPPPMGGKLNNRGKLKET